MNKKLHFASNLIPLILSRKKTVTLRLWDDKNLSKGDCVDFIETGTEKLFATARIIKTVKEPFGKLLLQDIDGHEKYKSNKEMYQIFHKYYQKPVGPETIVKIVSFRLLTNY